MKKLLALGALLGFLQGAFVPVEAQMTILGVGVPKAVGGGGGGYTGPGDIAASAVGWWGLRAYSAAYASGLGNAVEICTASDALCTVIHVTSSGGLNSSDLTASGCSGISTCTVKTLYDQSGNGHNCVQATEANRLTFDPNGVSSGKPSMHNAGSSAALSCSGITTAAAPWSISLVMKPSAAGGGYLRTFNFPDPSGILFSSGGKFSMYAGAPVDSTNPTASSSTFYSVIARTDGLGSGGVINVSGTVTSGLNPGSGSLSSPAEWSVGGSAMTNCDYVEGGFWGSNFSTGDTTGMTSNAQTY